MSLFLSQISLGCENGTAVISGQKNYPPISWREGALLHGALIDVVTRIFSELNIRIINDGGRPWKRSLRRAKKGEVDMLLGVRHSKEKEDYLIFLKPAIIPAQQSVFTKANREIIFNDWNDLEKLSGNRLLGDHFGEEFESFQQSRLHIESTETMKQAFKKLMAGRVDYLIGPGVTYSLYLQQSGLSENIKPLVQPLTTLNEHLTFSKKSTCIKHQSYFNRRLEELTKDKKIDAAIEDSFIQWMIINE